MRRLHHALALVATTLALQVSAQDKPPLKILVGFPPGGSADVMGRLVADALRQDFRPSWWRTDPARAGALRSRRSKQPSPMGKL